MNLRFETEAGEATLQVLRSTMENIESELQRARSSAEGLVPEAWEAPAANQFLDQAQGWAGMVSQSQEQLQQLCDKLRFEIDQWLEAARALG